LCLVNTILRVALKIHFGGQANLFVAELRHKKAALFMYKADFSALPASKNLLLAAQKQLLEIPLSFKSQRRFYIPQVSFARKLIHLHPAVRLRRCKLK